MNKQLLFGYDQFNRLASTSVLVGNQTTQTYSFAYDRYGNRWAQDALQGGTTTSLSYAATTNRVNTAGYTYDASGNMTNDGFHTYSYDAEGNVLTIDGGATASYVFDALNRRVSSQTSAGTFDFVFDPFGKRISTWNAANNTVTEGRIYWGNRQIAFRYQNRTYFDHQDYLGTERMRSDPGGAVDATYASLPWGDGYSPTVTQSALDSNTLHFAGLDSDTDTILHAQFRNYSATPGRWLSPDPYDGSYDITNPQSLNRYAYVLNNPTSFLDPLGLDCTQTVDPETGYTVNTCTVDGGGDGTLYPWFCLKFGSYCGLSGSGGTRNPGGGGGSGGTTGSAPSNTHSPSSCLASALSNGRGIALALDAVGDVATAAALANPASATAIIVASAASALGGLNSLSQAVSSDSISGLGLPLGTMTISATGALTSSFQIGGLIRAGTSFATGITRLGIAGSAVSTVIDGSAAISAYTNCRKGG